METSYYVTSLTSSAFCQKSKCKAAIPQFC